MRNVTYRIGIAGLDLEIEAASAHLTLMDEIAGLFPGTSGQPHLRLRLEPRSDAPPVVGVTSHGEVEDLRVDMDLSGFLDMDARHGVLRADAAATIVMSALRLTFAFLAPREGVLWLHAGCLVRQGRAFVLAGRSGAGKTTLTSMASPAERLADESVAVDLQTGRVHATPFQSAGAPIPPARAAPLEGVFFLRHGPTHKRRPIAAFEAVSRLWPCVLSPERNAEVAHLALPLLASLVSRTRTEELTFAPDPSALEHVS